MPDAIRILFLADSHLGFDLPARPRVERRRRGHDFLANYAAALAPAFAGEVDLVVHGGDVFDRASVIGSVAFQAFEPLRRIADRGVPVFIVPGNHERSRLPHLRFASHPRLHVFDRPRTFVVDVQGTRLALAGFPYERRELRGRFRTIVHEAMRDAGDADVRVLCMHHCVEGATVGPGDYMFTTAEDVVRHQDVPREFAAVFSGHIHRHQVLTTDLGGRRLEVPVLYPGSIERTSFAEHDEPKGFLQVHLHAHETARLRWEFCPLPARPMMREEITAEGLDGEALEAAVRYIVAAAPPDAVLSIRIAGSLTEAQWLHLGASRLRAFVPPTMNVEIRPDAPGRRARSPRVEPAPAESQLSFMDLSRGQGP